MGHFELTKKTDVKLLREGAKLDESDYSFHHDGEFYQFKFIRGEPTFPTVDVKPGVFKIVKSSSLYLQPTTFSNDEILDKFLNTVKIKEVIDSFFNNIHIYKEFGIEVARRNLLLYGPPGTGKTSAIAKCIQTYILDSKTAVITWDTNALDAYDVKSFISNFNYMDGVEKIIIVAEDIGGIENENVQYEADSSLLSILDNQDKTFKIPVMIISTTNYPANLAEAIANRPGRFDDKIEVGYPPSDARVELLKFFSKNKASDAAIAVLATAACNKFTPATIRESWIRHKLRNRSLEDIIKEMLEENKLYEKAFEKKSGLGF